MICYRTDIIIMGWTVKSLALLFALPVLGFCATALYLLHRKVSYLKFYDLRSKCKFWLWVI